MFRSVDKVMYSGSCTNTLPSIVMINARILSFNRKSFILNSYPPAYSNISKTDGVQYLRKYTTNLLQYKVLLAYPRKPQYFFVAYFISNVQM